MASAIGKTLLKLCIKPFSVSISKPQVRLNSYKVAILPQKASPFQIQTRKRDKLDKNQVRIQVNYCSVNSIDCITFLNESINHPFVPGYELSGEVIEVGKSVTNEQIIVGDRVVALSLDKCGGFAEECVVNVNDVWRLPSNVKSKTAAVLVCGHSTAVFTFSKLCNLKEGNTVLVSAGAAGLGLAAVDVAANIYKAKVISVVDTEGTGELTREEGAFQTVKFNRDLKKSVFNITNKGCDVVYDGVGEHMMSALGECVKTRGYIFHAAPYIYEKIPAPPSNTHLTVVSLHMLRQQDPELYRTMVSDTLQLANDGLITPHISANFNLANINDAVKFIDEKKCTGKVLLEIDD